MMKIELLNLCIENGQNPVFKYDWVVWIYKLFNVSIISKFTLKGIKEIDNLDLNNSINKCKDGWINHKSDNLMDSLSF